ncbi:unnamed protein product [Nesidiocoris tenuis]|uniref:Odorant receptor n=1 Tax=Nesidiocoris tenuis TaxID=355587 RepID=A0A6H5H6P9_9HEMI|nr:unnamed protein product [Nesidiocoris tenuis]
MESVHPTSNTRTKILSSTRMGSEAEVGEARLSDDGGHQAPRAVTKIIIIVRFYVHFTDWVLIVNYVTMIAAAVHSQSVLEFVMVGFPISAESLSLFLSYYSGYKNKDLTDLLLSFDDCFPDDPYPEQIDVEIEKASKYFYNFPRSLLWLQVFTMEIYCFIFPITNELMDDYFRPRALPLPSLYPCDWRESRPCFVTIIFIHFLGATYVNWKIIAFSEQFYAHVSRQVVLFRHLNHNLNRILNTIYVENDGSITYTKDKESDHIYIQRQLKLWVKHHQLVMATPWILMRIYFAEDSCWGKCWNCCIFVVWAIGSLLRSNFNFRFNPLSKWKYCDRPKIENWNGASEKTFSYTHLLRITSRTSGCLSVCPSVVIYNQRLASGMEGVALRRFLPRIQNLWPRGWHLQPIQQSARDAKGLREK